MKAWPLGICYVVIMIIIDFGDRTLVKQHIGALMVGAFLSGALYLSIYFGKEK